MAIKMNIATYNESKDGGGFHELHDIRFLSSPEHAVETVQSIINLNIKYSDEDCPLTGIEIACGSAAAVRLMNEKLFIPKCINLDCCYDPQLY